MRDLGRIGYADAMRLQDELVERRLGDEIGDTLLLLEHPPVITLGRRGSAQDIFVAEATLAKLGIGVERTTRGGLVTYHGPGQLVGYPIVRLRARGLSVPCYVHALELAIVEALGEIGVSAHVDDGHVGVWSALLELVERCPVTCQSRSEDGQPAPRQEVAKRTDVLRRSREAVNQQAANVAALEEEGASARHDSHRRVPSHLSPGPLARPCVAGDRRSYASPRAAGSQPSRTITWAWRSLPA